MSNPFGPTNSPPRILQFRLATLLVLITWSAIFCACLSKPTSFAAAAAAAAAILMVLTAILVAIYRDGRVRAMSLGFIVFWIGGWAYSVTWFGDVSALSYWFQKYHPYTLISPDAGFWSGDSSAYRIDDFLTIFHHALATLLGLLGSLLAQYLYATQHREKPSSNTQ